MTRTLKFWVDCDYQSRKASEPGRQKSEVVAEILRKYEEVGDAIRYLDRNGRIAWKATPKMLDRLADAERDARDELDEWP
jgi:hypothetical protein